MSDEQKVRLDKWLWAARFFKTRSLASAAVNGGKVHLNQHRVKSSRAVRPGDELDISRGPDHFTVIVEGLSARRGPAREAQQLYRETVDSVTRREAAAALRKLEYQSSKPSPHRPSGRDRKKIRSFTGRD